jgi:hypothetical protein
MFKNLTAAAAHIAQYYQARAQNALNLACFAARISYDLSSSFYRIILNIRGSYYRPST